MSKIKNVNNLPLDNNDLKTLKRIFQVLDLPIELLNVYWVYELGTRKHGQGSWLHPDNKSLLKDNNHASIARHRAKAYCGNPIDDESGVYHQYHSIARESMEVARLERKITSSNFKEIDKL